MDPEVTDAVVRDEVGRQRWFWLLLLTRGPIRGQSRAELDEIQAAHLRHLHTLRRRGQMTLFGPVEGAGALRGIGVLTVPTRDEAEALMAGDPAVRAGRLRAEVRPGSRCPEIACPTEVGRSRRRPSGAGLDPVAGGDLDPSALVGGWMLDEGDEAVGHEPACPDRRARAGHLANLHDAARGDDLEPPAGPRGRDLERLRALAGIDDGLDSIALHRRTVVPRRQVIGVDWWPMCRPVLR